MVAILGILSAIAIPAIAGISDEANVRRCQRIAQEFSLQANNAVAAGNLELTEASTVAEALDLISKGVYGTDVFADTLFQYKGVSMADCTEAALHLSLVEGRIIFDPRDPN